MPFVCSLHSSKHLVRRNPEAISTAWNHIPNSSQVEQPDVVLCHTPTLGPLSLSLSFCESYVYTTNLLGLISTTAEIWIEGMTFH